MKEREIMMKKRVSESKTSPIKSYNFYYLRFLSSLFFLLPFVFWKLLLSSLVTMVRLS